MSQVLKAVGMVSGGCEKVQESLQVAHKNAPLVMYSAVRQRGLSAWRVTAG